jgi:predicted MPP superfamily phosphohydrolase
VEPQRLVVTRAQLELPGWPKELAGLKVALLADLHVGSPFWDVAALSRLVERTNAEQPDLVLLAGDYQINNIPGGVHVGAEAIAQCLGGLRAPLGVFAVLGNHDCGTMASERAERSKLTASACWKKAPLLCNTPARPSSSSGSLIR